jgi:hypothetical protein
VKTPFLTEDDGGKNGLDRMNRIYRIKNWFQVSGTAKIFTEDNEGNEEDKEKVLFVIGYLLSVYRIRR